MSSDPGITFTNDLAELERLDRVVDAFGRGQHLSPTFVFDLQLATNEVFTNIVRYGYDDGGPHEIVVRLIGGDDEVVSEIEDDGRPFDPSTVPTPRLDVPLERRQAGGLGLYLARRVSDALDYRRAGNRNVLRIRKKVARPAEIAEDRRDGVLVLRLHGRLD